MPMDKNKYAQDWKAISAAVRQDAGNRCEFCGVENHYWIHRHKYADEWVYHYDFGKLSAIDQRLYKSMILVVLTVAHLDHDTRNNDRSNLRALCQKCHLTYDAQHHAQNARKTRAEKKADAIAQTGQLSIFNE